MFAQLGVITRTGKKYVEIVAASKRYLIINSGIKEAAVPNMLSSKVNWYNNVMEKQNLLQEKHVEYKLVVKYIENLVIEKSCCYF